MACCQQVARCGSAAARAARAPRRARVIAAAEGAAAAPAPARRAMLSAGAALAAGATVGVAPASAAGGYVPVKDLQDNYEFLYPQGWEEVRVQGQDKVFKDLIEPLESVSVTVLPTQTEKLTDLGDAKTVAPQFIDKVRSGARRAARGEERGYGGAPAPAWAWAKARSVASGAHR